MPCSPTARSSQQVSAPEPAPASSTRAPGNTSANATIWAASLGYTTAAPRLAASVKSASSGRKTT